MIRPDRLEKVDYLVHVRDEYSWSVVEEWDFVREVFEFIRGTPQVHCLYGIVHISHLSLKHQHMTVKVKSISHTVSCNSSVFRVVHYCKSILDRLNTACHEMDIFIK